MGFVALGGNSGGRDAGSFNNVLEVKLVECRLGAGGDRSRPQNGYCAAISVCHGGMNDVGRPLTCLRHKAAVRHSAGSCVQPHKSTYVNLNNGWFVPLASGSCYVGEKWLTWLQMGLIHDLIHVGTSYRGHLRPASVDMVRIARVVALPHTYSKPILGAGTFVDHHHIACRRPRSYLDPLHCLMTCLFDGVTRSCSSSRLLPFSAIHSH